MNEFRICPEAEEEELEQPMRSSFLTQAQVFPVLDFPWAILRNPKFPILGDGKRFSDERINQVWRRVEEGVGKRILRGWIAARSTIL